MEPRLVSRGNRESAREFALTGGAPSMEPRLVSRGNHFSDGLRPPWSRGSRPGEFQRVAFNGAAAREPRKLGSLDPARRLSPAPSMEPRLVSRGN